MKKISIIIFSLVLISCGPSAEERMAMYKNEGFVEEHNVDHGEYIKVIEVDSCEYIIARLYNDGIGIIHKQNCKNHK